MTINRLITRLITRLAAIKLEIRCSSRSGMVHTTTTSKAWRQSSDQNKLDNCPIPDAAAPSSGWLHCNPS